MHNLLKLRLVMVSLGCLVCIVTTGCSQYIDPNVPEPIHPCLEPEFGGDYLLYRPSGYNREQAWPLVVTCHAGFPDSPGKRIRAWTQSAETHGFLVAVPTLEGTRKRISADVRRQLPLQRRDEERILATVRHVRAGHNISTDRILLHGWSSGAYAALHTGLRHPDVFRAIALSQPAFEEGYVSEADDLIDPHQPVFVEYGLVDTMTGKHARRCVDWLRKRGVNLTDDLTGTVRPNSAGRCVEFFEDVVRNMPWMRIRAFSSGGSNPMAVQFKAQCSFAPAGYRWAFGDGETSGTPEPVHVFAGPGVYRVSLTADRTKGHPCRRIVDVKVPGAVVIPARRKPAADES